MPEIKLAIFDKDGTLLDSSPATLEGHIKTLSSISTPEETTELINSTLGYNADRQYAIMRIAKKRKLPVRDVIENENAYAQEVERLRQDKTTLELVDTFWNIVKQVPVSPFPDTRDALQLLKDAGFSMGISTGYRPDIVIAQLETSRLIKFFDENLIFGYDPPIVKGDPHIQELMRRRRLNIEQLKQVYMIGDGVGEMGTAKKYGMIAYGIDRVGNEEQLRRAGAVEVFRDLIECSRYILQRGK